nr:MAG TPA: hypothetical protein [Caudoviricetes sp.]
MWSVNAPTTAFNVYRTRKAMPFFCTLSENRFMISC